MALVVDSFSTLTVLKMAEIEPAVVSNLSVMLQTAHIHMMQELIAQVDFLQRQLHSFN